MSVRTLLVLGGARAGKSAYALERARRPDARVVFVATAEARDPEMVARIARHRAARPAHWATVEAPLGLADVLGDLEGKADVVVVDCLTLWVANLLERHPEPDDGGLARETDRLVALVARRPFELVLVSNEVGAGVHPPTAIGLRFRDALGVVNQAVARAADEVVLLVAGCPLWLKRPA